MSWQPNANEPAAVFEEPIIDNALTIITRDFKGALDYYYPGVQLPDFKERELGKPAKNVFPCLAITPKFTDIEIAEDNSNIAEAARFDIYIGVTSNTAQAVTRLIMKYVRTMHHVIKSAKDDFFEGMSNPFEVHIEIRHDYGPIGEDETNYFRAAIVGVTIYLRER